MAVEFFTPEQAAKVLAGVIPGNKPNRPNLFSKLVWTNSDTWEGDTVNFDQEYDTSNVMGSFVSPNVDVDPILLGNYDHKHLVFSYTKEGFTSGDFDENNRRQLGDPIGQVDVWANELKGINKKLAYAMQRFENLSEYTASQIVLTGGYTAASERHPTVKYDFGRTVVNTATGYADSLVPYIDLTTLTINGGAGRAAWGYTGTGTVASPVLNLIKMVETAKYRNSVKMVVMSANAYAEFNKDLTTNYPKASDLTLAVVLRQAADVLPRTKEIEGLTYKTSYAVNNGELVDIFVYEGTYTDRTTGVKTSYFPSGYVAVIPEFGAITVYGRIKHRKAQFRAMPTWINTWSNEKTGAVEWELHRSFITGHTDINSLVCWKVM